MDIEIMKKDDYFLESERLYVKPYSMDYFPALKELKQLPETHRYNYSQIPNEQNLRSYIQNQIDFDFANPGKSLELAILLKPEENYIGYIGLKGSNFEINSTAEIYYTLHPDHFGKGLATEAVKTVLEFAFSKLKLHRIWAGATVENTASWKIMEKLGMRRECHWVKDRPKPGKWIAGQGFEKTDDWEDGYGYAITREEFMLSNPQSQKNL
jgi:ribosomal-protein-alanine N-acetyltransferase